MTLQLLTDHIPADVSGWWVSEKYDGVRAIWTGTKLLTRNGKDLKAPAWFTAGLPENVRLDGELWMGRTTFELLVSVIQKKDSDWDGVKYMVFDLAGSGTFEDRNQELFSMTLPPQILGALHWSLKDRDDLDYIEKGIVGQGGEGCVIRRPGCKYRPGRMGDVIKVKRLVADVDRWQG
jgi:DNA ligase-1